MQTPYTTKSGVQIGSLYTRPMPGADRDAERMQLALLGERQAIDWDGIYIAATIVAAVIALVVAA